MTREIKLAKENEVLVYDDEPSPEWTRSKLAKLMRMATPKAKRQPCWLCGKHQAIAQLHHVIPVHVLVELVMNYSIEPTQITMTMVWLCPNHHAMWHLFESKQKKRRQELYRGSSSEDLELIVKLHEYGLKCADELIRDAMRESQPDPFNYEGNKS